MVTLEALMNAGMSEEEARRILEIYNGEKVETEEAPPMADASEEDQQAETEEPTAEEPEAEPAASEEPEAPDTEAQEPPAEGVSEAEESVQEAPVESGPQSVNPLDAENAVLRARVVQIGIRAAGLAAGVKPERLEALERLADASGVEPMAEDAQAQIDEAVQRALSLVPELAMTAPAVTTGSAGMHPREPANATDPFSRGFRG